ncbi:MAG: trypsin-like peptidase domain-containing protein [Planctomycetaceae bacterium]|nr:trypsin-like peptidase domain-containing protein [Planctomycetaceae bacterium]
METSIARWAIGILSVVLAWNSAVAEDLGFVRIEARIEQGRAIVAFNGAQIGRGLILTCAHCCQSAGGRGAAVSVQILAAGTWKPYRTVRGVVLCYDPASDCGLIRLEDPDALATAYVLAPRRTVMQPGDEVHAFRWQASSESLSPVRGEITRMNPYVGSPVIETSTAPRPGDSGGPLILAERRQIVGVTSALNLELQRGIYCGLDPIWQLIDRCGQTALVEP